MTKEERDRREAEKRARLSAAPDLGGVSLPVSRGNLLRAFWSMAVLLGVWLLIGARADLNGENTLVACALFVLCLAPAWLWASGHVAGLPIFPVFALTFIPTYLVPLWKGAASLATFTTTEINTAGWTLAGFLAISTVIWHQICVVNRDTPPSILMIEQLRSEWILMLCLLIQVVFEIGIFFFKGMGEGIFPVIRSFAGSAGRLGLFIFSYQLGKGKLHSVYRALFLGAVSLILLRQVSSLLLSTALPTVGIVFAGYILGKGKIPWISLGGAVFALAILQMGKVEMRDQYFAGQKETSLMDASTFFSEWIGYGLKNMGIGRSKEAKREDVESVQERGSLIQVMIKVQQKTPSQLPYLEGETYRYVPEMLIPRIFNKEKIWAHAGNMILSMYYGFLEKDQIFMTSIAFDPIIEAYANYGFAGVFFLATLMGLGIGFLTNLTTRVPMLSFRFLAGLQLLAVLLASFNTAGVFVTSLWQSLISLSLLAAVLMKKRPNPLFILSTSSHKSRDRTLPGENGGENQQRVPAGTLPSNATASMKNERPTRFVYGKKKV